MKELSVELTVLQLTLEEGHQLTHLGGSYTADVQKKVSCMSCDSHVIVMHRDYRIAGKVGGEFTLANWRFLCPPPKYNPPNISLKKPNILHCIRNHRLSMKKQGVTC